MRPVSQGEFAPLPERTNAERLLCDLREANEKLLVAAIESEKLKERAEAAQAAAELTARALRESERELVSNVEFREQLLGLVGHDLRNPLNAILLSSGLLHRYGRLSLPDTRLVGMITRCARRMERMIDHVLDFTRVRVGGGLAIEIGPADLREACEQAAGELSLQPGVHIRSEFQGPLTGLWDGQRLVQVMSNLLGNALDHAIPGTSVVMRARGTDTEVTVEVCNEGEPIPADLLPVLFGPFRRGHKEGIATRGHLGLGLYIAREIVSAHLGSISAASVAGTTTFSVRLPRSPVPS